MKRRFQEFREDGDDMEAPRPRARASGFTDAELADRFATSPTLGEELMDEETVKRMLARERRQAQSLDQETRDASARQQAQPLEREAGDDSARQQAQPLEQEARDDSAQEACQEQVADAPRVEECDAPTTTSLPQAMGPAMGVQEFQAGDIVILKGLKAFAHLNGQRGKLERLDPVSGRWTVQLSDGDAKAIKVENLESLPPGEANGETSFAPPESPEIQPPSPQPAPDVAPRSPPQQMRPPSATGSTQPGEVAGLSSASLASSVGSMAPSSRNVPGTAAAAAAERRRSSSSARRMGTIRWYNGRRKLGMIMPDSGSKDLFIPAQGALNGSMAPPQPGGLFHGTRVSYLPAALKPVDQGSGGSSASNKNPDIVCMDVRPLAGQVGLSCGVDTTEGAKERNDDRLAASDLQELGFLAGVFDGHRGSSCAEYVCKQMPSTLLSAYRARVKRAGGIVRVTHSQEADLISSALVDAFTSIDSQYLVAAKKKELADGATAVVALLAHGFEVPVIPAAEKLGAAALWSKVERNDLAQPERQPGTVARAPGGVAKLFIAWCGDSRAVLLRGRQGLRCTEDHRPGRRDELQRIQRAGGMVAQDARGVWRVGPREESKFVRELDKRKKKNPKELKWFLSTSRSFGDHELKIPDEIVTARPEVKAVDLVPEDWAVLLACDGIFDVLSDQEVADTIWKSIVVQGKDAVGAAKAVVQAAFGRGSRDNLTAVVLRLGWSAPPLPTDTAPGPEPKAKDDFNMFG